MKYGDIEVEARSNDGYVDVTNLLNGKDLSQWLSFESSRELVRELSNSGEEAVAVDGLFVNPLLVAHIAAWAAPKFAIQMSRIVNSVMSDGAPEVFENQYCQELDGIYPAPHYRSDPEAARKKQEMMLDAAEYYRKRTEAMEKEYGLNWPKSHWIAHAGDCGLDLEDPDRLSIAAEILRKRLEKIKKEDGETTTKTTTKIDITF